MIDTSSIKTFMASLPRAPKSIERLLSLKMRLPETIPIEAASLAHRGYLGCLPFAYHGDDEIVLRLLPERSLADSTVAIAWGSITEGTTIAPDLSRFVAGRLAHMDVGKPGMDIDSQLRNQLLEFASEFGDTSSVNAVLEIADTLSSVGEASIRQGKLWEAACPEDPLCRAIAGAWTHQRRELKGWLDQAIHQIPDIEIVLRLYVSYHAIYRTGVDLTDEAWKLVEGDNVFDPTYTGAFYGPALGAWLSEALSYAVSWLQDQKQLDPVRSTSPLWTAALAYEESENYDGAEHLAAARKLAAADPMLAYIQAANAAAFNARVSNSPPEEAIAFAHELAIVNNWKDLCVVLEWAQKGLSS